MNFYKNKIILLNFNNSLLRYVDDFEERIPRKEMVEIDVNFISVNIMIFFYIKIMLL